MSTGERSFRISFDDVPDVHRYVKGLVGVTNVSPNAVRDGRDVEKFRLRFDCPDGVPGNSDRHICKFHGWRGTTDDRSVHAYGEREIVGVRQLESGDLSVTVGPDRRPDEE